MKPVHIALLAGVGLVGFLAIRQMTMPVAPPPSSNPSGGTNPGGAGGGQGDYQSTVDAIGKFFGAVGSVAQVVAKQS